MPQLTAFETIQLVLLLMCVPIQFYLSTYSSESNRHFHVNKLVSELGDFSKNWLMLDSWKEWCSQFIKPFVLQETQIKDDHEASSILSGEKSMQSEVKQIQKKGWFGHSLVAKDIKDPKIIYSVGQVVKHKVHGYRGVIVGWDIVANAPENWLAVMHEGKREQYGQQPNYAILVDTRDRPAPQFTYVPQENVGVVDTAVRILHPLTDQYFESFDENGYKPRPWLRKAYPHN